MAPATVLAVRFNVDPAHTGVLLLAVGEEGIGLTTTVVVPAIPGQPLIVAVTEYVPAAPAFTLEMEGFCNVDEKLLGPLHEYVAPVTVLAVRFNVEPAQTGLLLLAVGVAGVGITVTVTLAGV